MKKHSGFTLIEVLVAVVILAGGLLGLAALQATSLGNNTSAYYRSQATQLAYDMADRMRANSADAKLATDGNVATVSAYLGAVPASGTTTCATSGCSTADMARNDLFEWSGMLRLTLLSGTGIVCIDSTPGDGVPGAPACDNIGSRFVIKIGWDDDKSGVVDRYRFQTNFML